MSNAQRIAVLGFSDFERNTLASCFRLTANRVPHYEQVKILTDADFVLADADHAPSVQLVLATERMDETVFIGQQPPAGAVAWMARPIDAMHVMRELDALVTGSALAAPPGSASGTVAAAPAAPTAPAAAAPATAAPADVAAGDAAAASLPPAAKARRTRAAAAPAAADTSAAPSASPAPLAPPPPRALLVDDSEIALRFLESRLQRWGMVMDRASSSSKAIELLARRDYDFVFLDLELGPGSTMDGLALCQHIKRNQSANAALGSSVFIVSAHQTELDRVRGTLAGCDAYLGKPLQEVELHRLLLRHGLKPPAAEASREGASREGASPA